MPVLGFEFKFLQKISFLPHLALNLIDLFQINFLSLC